MKKRRYPNVQAHRSGWRAVVRLHGKRRKGQTRHGPDAQRLAYEDAQVLLEKRGTEVSWDATLAGSLEAIEAHCKRRNRRPATEKYFRDHLHPWIARFGEDRKLASIRASDVQVFVDERTEAGIAGRTVHHDVRCLVRACHLTGVPSPVSQSVVIPPIQPRDPAEELTWEGLLQALAELEGVDRAVLTFVAGTGIRRTELARMRKQDLDVVGMRVIVATAKTTPRVLPLVEAAGPTVGVLLGLPGDLLLPGKTERARINFLHDLVARARKKTGERRLALHELRRCFASKLAATEPLQTVAFLLGHAIPGVTGIYVRADAGALRSAMEKVWSELKD